LEPTYLLAKGILKPSLAAWFRWTLEGIERIPRSGGTILAFNHIAFLDAFAAAYVVDKVGRRVRFLAKSELFEDKRISWILRGAGQIEVRRGTREAPMALDHGYRALERGELVAVFPEGTITNDPDLKPMAAKSGAARLALKTGAPLIPCALWGTQNVWPKGFRKHWWPPRQDIAVMVGEPLAVAVGDESREAIADVSQRLTEQMSLLLAGLRPAIADQRRPKKRMAA
jgi:1-acyl-sn-glycerol-3-phosphate acyltransferase